jgi:LacI family transcriptional regulator
VEAAIERLGYRVNSYARGLKTNRTNCVALLMPSLYHPFFAILTDELTACLMRHGYRSMLMITNYDPEAEKKCLILGHENKVDGVIALTYSPDLKSDDSTPMVTIDRHCGDSIPCVSSDNLHGGEMAVEKLAELGCRRLLFMGITSGIPGEVDKRGAGFEAACRRLHTDYEQIILNDEDTEAPFYAFLSEHIHGGKLDFDGIFCNTDSLACRVIAFLAEHGVRVPQDVQIIGYDGLADYATGRYPCSTIVQPIPRMAEEAVKLLLDADNIPNPVNICLPVRYAWGGTTLEVSSVQSIQKN